MELLHYMHFQTERERRETKCCSGIEQEQQPWPPSGASPSAHQRCPPSPPTPLSDRNAAPRPRSQIASFRKSELFSTKLQAVSVPPLQPVNTRASILLFARMATDLDFANQEIEKVELRIAHVDAQLETAASEVDVTYLRKKQLREEKKQLRDEKLLLLRADKSAPIEISASKDREEFWLHLAEAGK